MSGYSFNLLRERKVRTLISDVYRNNSSSPNKATSALGGRGANSDDASEGSLRSETAKSLLSARTN